MNRNPDEGHQERILAGIADALRDLGKSLDPQALLGEIEASSGQQVESGYLQAATRPGEHLRKPDPWDFGYAVAWEALTGEKVWQEEHPSHGLRIRRVKEKKMRRNPYFGDVFGNPPPQLFPGQAMPVPGTGPFCPFSQNPGWVKGTIMVPTMGKYDMEPTMVSVPASIYGDLAVHKDLTQKVYDKPGKKKGWRISRVMDGLAMPYLWRTEKIAKAAAKKMVDQWPGFLSRSKEDIQQDPRFYEFQTFYMEQVRAPGATTKENPRGEIDPFMASLALPFVNPGKSRGPSLAKQLGEVRELLVYAQRKWDFKAVRSFTKRLQGLTKRYIKKHGFAPEIAVQKDPEFNVLYQPGWLLIYPDSTGKHFNIYTIGDHPDDLWSTGINYPQFDWAMNDAKDLLERSLPSSRSNPCGYGKRPQKRSSNPRPKALTGADKHMIETIVNNQFHVGTPDAEVEDYFRKRFGTVVPQWIVRQIVKVALKQHHENFKLYAQVMTGRF